MKFQVKETQTVNFVFDRTKSFSKFYLCKTKKYKKIFIIYDKYLGKTWLKKLLYKIDKKQKISLIPLSATEKTKHITSISSLSSKLEDGNCSRSDLIIAMGGGTILDISGFIASVYMRGVDLVMVPTTLMGQTDASSAGKTCVNGKLTKNLLGTLYLPKAVYNNVAVLKSCSNHSNRQGLSEILKYALLGSKKLLILLDRYSNKRSEKLLLEIIKETIKIRIKLRIVDPLKSNLGHTFGHAFESDSKNLVSHGDAISVGTLFALKLSIQKKMISQSDYEKVYRLMQKLNLNTKVDKSINITNIVNLMMKDKKSNGTHIGFVLLKEIGNFSSNSNLDFSYIDPLKIKAFLKKSFENDNILIKDHWKKLSLS